MALALDGTPVNGSQGSGTTAVTGTLSTSNGSGNIVIAIASNAGPVVSVAASGLSFAQRLTITGTQGPALLAVYTAVYTTNFSGAITVTMTVANQYSEVIAWGVSGSPATAQFDTGAGIPGSSTSTTSPITTTNPNDFVYSVNALSATTDTPGAGWTLIATTGFLLCEYQIVSSTGTFTGTTGGGLTQGSIIDAIVAGAQATPDPGTIGRSGIIRVAKQGWRWT
jgi:hypothetical protein